MSALNRIPAPRNLPIAASVARKHASMGLVAGASAAVRALPAEVSRALTRTGPVTPTVAALAAGAAGDEPQALRELGRLARTAGPRRAAHAVDGLTALHRFAEARAAFEVVRDRFPGADLARVEARLLLAEGHPGRAKEALDRAGVSRRATLRAIVEGELSALDASSRIPSRVEPGGQQRRDEAQPIRRVLHLVTKALPDELTGYTVRTQGIAAAQLQHGQDVLVVPRIGFPVDSGVAKAPVEVSVEGVRYRRLLPGRPLSLSAGDRLDATIGLVGEVAAAYAPDLLHAHSKHHNAQVAIAVGRARGIPVVYEVRGFLEETWRTRGGDPESQWYQRSRAAETSCMAAADAVVTLSESMRKAIVERGIPAERVYVVPNAVDPIFLDPPDQHLAVRAELGIGPAEVVVGFSGTVNAYEGLDTLVDAIVGLDQVHLLVVGSGPALAGIRDRVAAFGPRAHLVGRVPHAQVPAYLQAMDLYAVPRRRTPVTALVPPLKPVEALAVGVPVIASELPPLVELAEASSAVTIVPPEDVAAWRAAIEDFISDPAPARAAARAAQEWTRRERTWAHCVELYRDVYAGASLGAG